MQINSLELKLLDKHRELVHMLIAFFLPEDSDNGNLTLYINYLNSSTANNTTQQFTDGELLICNEIIILDY